MTAQSIVSKKELQKTAFSRLIERKYKRASIIDWEKKKLASTRVCTNESMTLFYCLADRGAALKYLIPLLPNRQKTLPARWG
jgi:hypothetical protein